MTMMLSARNLGLRYGERDILKGVDLDVSAGEALAIIGPNGVGKTTLLRVLSGALRPTEGEVRFSGEVIRRVDRRLARLIAFVPQMMHVPFEFTVEQIVRQGRRPHNGLRGRWTENDAGAVENALESSDTATLRRRIFHTLSGGEQQRVKLAIAIAQQPKLLLLDEPTQQLDIGRQYEIADLIRRLHLHGMTIVAAIHELTLVESTFRSVLLLSPQEAPRRGTPSEMLRPELLESAFNCPPRYQPKLVSSAKRRVVAP
jgi:ABC-type cobalamin/Fe3+-siderophores transport system ATPase subunit